MKSKITTIISLSFIILLIIAASRGLDLGVIKISSISELLQKNDMLEEKITEVSNLNSVEYPTNIQTLEDTFNDYLDQKQKYQQLSGMTTGIDEESYETKQYDIGYLWRIIGKYATEEKFSGDPGLKVALDVKKSSIGNNSYNFNFTVTGTYTRISQFLIDIENDSDLYFRIHDFAMKGKEASAEDGSKIIITEATFTVKNIGVEPSTIK